MDHSRDIKELLKKLIFKFFLSPEYTDLQNSVPPNFDKPTSTTAPSAYVIETHKVIHLGITLSHAFVKAISGMFFAIDPNEYDFFA